MKLLIILLFTISVQAAEEYHLDIIDLGNGKSKVTLTDLCDKDFSIIVKQGEFLDGKLMKWLEKLNKSDEFDACLKEPEEDPKEKVEDNRQRS